MRALQKQLQFNMRRDEERQRLAEKRNDEAETLRWRQEQEHLTRRHNAETKSMQKTVELQESRDYQEFKRDLKPLVKEQENQAISEAYNETKENSEWQAEYLRGAMTDKHAGVVEAHLDQYRIVAERKAEEQRLEDFELTEARTTVYQREMDLQLQKARQERDRALEGLQHAQTSSRILVPPGQHLAARRK